MDYGLKNWGIGIWNRGTGRESPTGLHWQVREGGAEVLKWGDWSGRLGEAALPGMG